MGKTLVQCLCIGALLAGGLAAPALESSSPTKKTDYCECGTREKPIDCAELLKDSDAFEFLGLQIFCASLRSSSPLQKVYKTLRTSAPEASVVITIDQLEMNVVPARFLAGIHAHILHLNTTNVKAFDAEAFDGFETRVLDMKTNTPTRLPLESIKRIPQLGTLTLYGFDVEVVRKNDFAESISVLGLSSCGVQKIEEGALPSGLILLYLDGNRDLTADGLRGAFKSLSKLRTLSMHDTGIHGFKKEMFNGLKNLMTLYLVNCNLKKLDEDIFSTLPKLDSLFLSKNYLRDFGFMVNTNISNLNVDDNNLTTLDDELFQHKVFRNLRSLNLNNNGFVDVPAALRHLRSLVKLSLSGNHIGKLNWSALNGLRKLESLNLERNELLTIEGYPDLPDLWTLNLAGNLLEDLQGTVHKLHLGNLNLAANRIEKLSLEDLPATLRRIKLQGNPIHCETSGAEGYDRQLFKSLAKMIHSNRGAPFKDCI